MDFGGGGNLFRRAKSEHFFLAKRARGRQKVRFRENLFLD